MAISNEGSHVFNYFGSTDSRKLDKIKDGKNIFSKSLAITLLKEVSNNLVFNKIHPTIVKRTMFKLELSTLTKIV